VVPATAQVPSWWTNRLVLTTNPPNDFAAVNQGQLKWLAVQAAVEFSNSVPRFAVAGSNILSMVASFAPSNNYLAANVGQLKTVATPFYDFLWQYGLIDAYPVGAGSPYPWSGSTNAPNDYAPANGGQAKYLFSFDVGSALLSDTDGDGIPAWWEIQYGLDPRYGGEDGVVAWWKLDEGAGIDLYDATTNTNNGILYDGGTSAWADGIIGRGLFLNGVDAYAAVPDSATLRPDYLSVGLWIELAQPYVEGTLAFVSKLVPEGLAGYSLGYEEGDLVFTVCSSGANVLRYTYALEAGVPAHVVGTYSGTRQALYINGALVASANYDWGSGDGKVDQDANVLRLGAASGETPAMIFGGLLDDVRIYPGEWSSNQVKAIWELGADPDGDGISTLREFHASCSPIQSDTDGDGLSDGEELDLTHTSPTNKLDGAVLLEDARDRLELHWNMIFPTPLTFTNPPGSSADLNDIAAALGFLSTNLYRVGTP
jgi:hypothetical protein